MVVSVAPDTPKPKTPHFQEVNQTVRRTKTVKLLAKSSDICNITLNSVRQHNCFITEGNYIGYMFRLYISHLQVYFGNLSHKMLSTLWNPIVFTSMEYIKLNHLSHSCNVHVTPFETNDKNRPEDD